MKSGYPQAGVFFFFVPSRLAVALALLSTLFVCGFSPKDDEPTIRVCLYESARPVQLKLNNPGYLQSNGKTLPLAKGVVLECELLANGSLRIMRDGQTFAESAERMRLYSAGRSGTLSLNNRSYPDTLWIAPAGRKFVVVNSVALETYLPCVVANELGRNLKDAEYEAAKAQAVIARTYALMQMSKPSIRLFDVYADTRDQVYSGAVSVPKYVTKAVAETRGKALTYDGRYAECYFHSTCGGATESVQNLWARGDGAVYLQGVRDWSGKATFCKASPFFRWTEHYTRKELESILRIYIPSANEKYSAKDFPTANWRLLDMKIAGRTPSGRVKELTVVMGNMQTQKEYVLLFDKIRWGLRRPDGKGILRSTMFDLEIDRDANRWIRAVTIKGGGNGHGAGLCQWGSLARAREGYSMEDILEAYFPGAAVGAVY